MQKSVNRSILPGLPQGLMTPLDRVQPISGGNRHGSWEVSSSLTKICSSGRGKSMPRQSDRAATARWQPRFRMLSPNGTTPQVDQATHTEAFADFAQLRATCREETSQQPVPAKLLDLKLPALGATAQPLENPGELCRDRSLSLAKKAAGVVDQLESPRSHRRPPQKYPRVPRAGSPATACGCGLLHPTRTRGGRSASRSDTSG